MRVGVRIAQTGCLSQPAGIRLAAVAAEQVGYSSLWTVDGAARAPEAPCSAGLDAVGALALAARVTSRLHLGTSVPLGCYPEMALAPSLAGLNQLAEGRLSLALDADDASGSDGGVEAGLRALAAPWSERRRPRVLLTTYSAAGLEQVARRADGWSPAGLPPDVLVPMWGRVRQLAATHGRDPDALELVVGAEIELSHCAEPRHPGPYCGTIEQVVDDVEQTRRAGAHEIVLGVRGDPSVDEALAIFASVAEALELRAGDG